MAPLAIGVVLVVLLYMGGHISGAHYNPAVTLAVFIRGRCQAGDVAPYMAAQLIGGTIAALVVRYVFAGQFMVGDAPSEITLWIPGATGAIIASELLFTFLLCFVVLNVATSKNTAGNDYFGIDPKLNFRDLDVLAVGPAAKEAGDAFDLYWNSPAAVPIAVLLKEPVADDELERRREELKASLDELDALPYTVPKEAEETRSALKQLAEEMVWAETEIIIDTLERFEGGSESAFAQLTSELAESAEHEFVIETAYLIPTKEAIAKVAEIIERGLRVRILTNSMRSNNHTSVHAHYMKYRKRMIEAGIELHELRPDPELLEHYKQVESRVAESHAGLHTKAFVVDGRLSMIGSYNMDPRSRIWNSEIGLLIDSEEFAAKVLEVMEADFDPANSYRVTLDEKRNLQWTAEGPDWP